jgi:hypothetical protein
MIRLTKASAKIEAMIIQVIGLFFIQKSINQVQKYNILKDSATEAKELYFFYKNGTNKPNTNSLLL